MAELHTEHPTSTLEDVLYGIYLHTQDVGSQVSLGDDGGTDLVYNGTTWGGTPASASFFSAVGSIIVIQGVHPNAEKWWVEITLLSTTTIQTDVGFDGLYTTGLGFSGTTESSLSQTLGPSFGDHVRVSSSTEDTYNGGSSIVNYFRWLFFDSSATSYDNGVYTGNFIPTDPTEGKPFVFLYGFPNSGISSEWGRITAGNGFTWSDLAHTGTTFAGTLVHTNTLANGINGHPQDYAGNFITSRVLLHAGYANIVGYFGDSALRAVSETAITNGTTIVGGGYFSNEGFLHRWLP